MEGLGAEEGEEVVNMRGSIIGAGSIESIIYELQLEAMKQGHAR